MGGAPSSYPASPYEAPEGYQMPLVGRVTVDRARIEPAVNLTLVFIQINWFAWALWDGTRGSARVDLKRPRQASQHSSFKLSILSSNTCRAVEVETVDSQVPGAAAW